MSDKDTNDTWKGMVASAVVVGLIAIFSDVDLGEVGNWILGALYVVWVVIKWPLIVIGCALVIYGLVKFIKWCWEN